LAFFALLHDAGRRHGDRPALDDGAVRITYAQLIARSLGLGASLRRQGVARGDRVVLCMENCAAYLETLLACWAAGACAVPVNAKLHAREIAHIVGDCGARIIFATPPQATALLSATDRAGGDVALPARLVIVGSDEDAAMRAAPPQAPVDTGPEAPAWLFYTSGTTGRPKGAILTHRNLIFMSLAYFADIAAPDGTEQMLHLGPLSHGSGLYALPHLLRGCEQVILPQFDAEAAIERIDRGTRVSTFVVPTTLLRLMQAPGAADLRRDRIGTICYGGAPMYRDDLERAVAMFPGKLFHVYGQGESPMTISGLPQGAHADPAARASCGWARTGVALRVVDPDGRDLPAGAVGEVITRSDCVMAGYWNNPDATARALRDGWLHTGDLGSLDAAGLLTLRDRSKDVIISGGSNIYPREIEEVLLRHPDVREAAVIGLPHPDWGEEVVACIAPRPGRPHPSESELDALCLAHVARFKRPKRYLFWPDLPKSDYGKILKTTLRDWAREGAPERTAS
jgi:acyl-CoA synthetase (AMP-forming)/AMP-acid ligase II